MAKTFTNVKRGYTLIELTVAMGLFVIVVSIAIGGFVSILRDQRVTAALIAANSNVSLILEQMAREMRTGRDFCDAAPPCSPAASSRIQTDAINFISSANSPISYKFNDTTHAIERSVNGGAYEQLTGDNVVIQYLHFSIFAANTTDEFPTRVTIAVGVSAKEKDVSSAIIRLQTTVSLRQIDG